MTRKYTTITLLMLLAATASGADKPNFLEQIFGIKPKRDTSGAAKEGSYTILLYVCRGLGSHIAQAKRYKANTEKYAGWKHLFIVHREGYSQLFWGKYATVKDAQPNLKKAKGYLAPAKVKVFAAAVVVLLPGKEDIGPPEWNLDNTDAKYISTVLVAEFHDDPDTFIGKTKIPYVGRKKFAIEYCKEIRKVGMAAFYRHGEVDSIVTVGLFGKNAVQNTKQGGKIVQTIKDRAINVILAKFPQLAVNGLQKIVPSVNPDGKTYRRIAMPSYLMKIPREKIQNAATTQPSPGNNLGHPKPGKTPGNKAGSGGSADKPVRPRSSRKS